jgi:hypothetical protein
LRINPVLLTRAVTSIQSRSVQSTPLSYVVFFSGGFCHFQRFWEKQVHGAIQPVSDARAHHFVPRCYLNNFTTAEKITAVDLTTGKRFTTNTKNVAQERDFNRIESATLPADALETAYAAFEGELAPVLKRLSNGGTCDEDEFSYVLNLIALLAIRNPRFRESFGEFQNNVRHQMLQLATATKERWEAQVAQARAAGYMEGVKDVPYEQMRSSVVKRNFKSVTSTSEHARNELNVLDTLLNILARRSWRWVHADENSGGFITSDHPVCLVWNKPPKGFAPLGYGLTGTTVYFSVSPSLALRGEFDGPTNDLKADVFSVGLFNRRIANNAHRQIYAANDKFVFFDYSDFFDIDDLLNRVRALAKDGASQPNS